VDKEVFKKSEIKEVTKGMLIISCSLLRLVN